ncbi:MAG: adenylosuccinate synthetase [Spirochaetes bacterium GWD1_61_31]|nr:MAG: adenylosuccinate synthetase [Spirochaetes bacterium GWB1_60_80]OHD30594.1 MAG: adenylosuccinate synthetase [Spirochaetes bacterium GWC1_61_12]OHD34863.1 MAG: adenylosuccinate synthetase [Spirochaetes bacterium GWD1_61_31]OHD46709.1 MAG: adenylosuccinate synthetase [Spirochaetes bacterium GWE1_60_18]OHD60337.1 MAG: adenylosuccinate synthetase [Spirochaetes bacterium GWF1_60_12]HAP44239.1 adenylosuccinate synthase [Spirochaetaceae bacterium]
MNLVIIGAQWGDEGKGKMVDYLAGEAQVIVRFSGGANAGHTIVRNNEQFALHLVPSGVLYPDKTVILGTGMVIDPESLFAELDMLAQRGVDWHGRVFISDRAHIVLPRYRAIDKEMEAGRKQPIGTTGRGIGVTYSMKASRDGVRLADLDDPDRLCNLSDADRAYIADWLPKLKPMSLDLTDYLARHRNTYTLFEGAQGTLLDIDSGTYPFVSSGMSCAAGASAQGGIGPRSLDKVLGVFKAYSTRVGNGPFPTEFDANSQSALDNLVRVTGREYGVTTGRPRRCGYLDLVALRYACLVNSFDALILTHLDVYDTLEDFEACVAYRIDGRLVEHFPAAARDLDKAEPVLRTFKGWKRSLKEVREYGELPREARDYISFIEEFTETPVDVVSVGYDRKETIVRKSPWIRS